MSSVDAGLLEWTGIGSLLVLFAVNAFFLPRANPPAKLTVPIIALASLAVSVIVVLLLGAGVFFLVIFGFWLLCLVLLWMFAVFLDKNLSISQSPRLYERFIFWFPRKGRLFVIGGYLFLLAILKLWLNRLDQGIVVSVLWGIAGFFAMLGLFSIFSVCGMARNLWAQQTAHFRILFVSVNAIYFFLVGTLVWNKCGCFDSTGAPCLRPRLQQIGSLQDGRVAFRENKLYGYLDNRRRIIIPARFLEARSFAGGLAAVRPRPSGLLGYIDTEGKMVIPPRFQSAGDFSGDLAAVMLEGRWGYVDPFGTIKIDTRFVDADRFYDGLAPVAVSRKDVWGIIDTSGAFVAGPASLGDIRQKGDSDVRVSSDYFIRISNEELHSRARLTAYKDLSHD